MEELIKAIQELGSLSWIDYVQLGLSVITILISALALFYAIKVPRKIAESQNRIALFEKRYEYYITFTKSIAFVTVIEKLNIDSKEKGIQLFLELLTGKSFDDIGKSALEYETKVVLYDVVAILGQAKYLFNLESDKLLELFSNDLVDLLKAKDDKDFQSCINKIKISASNVHAEFNDIFEKHLCINS